MNNDLAYLSENDAKSAIFNFSHSYPKERIELLYSLIGMNDNDCTGGIVYSLMIILLEEGKCTDSKTLYDIARSLGGALKVLEIFVRNGVTPVSAEDVFGEL